MNYSVQGTSDLERVAIKLFCTARNEPHRDSTYGSVLLNGEQFTAWLKFIEQVRQVVVAVNPDGSTPVLMHNEATSEREVHLDRMQRLKAEMDAMIAVLQKQVAPDDTPDGEPTP